MNTMSGRPVLPPPPHIAALMADAGRTRDDAALRRAHALYLGWLRDNDSTARRWDD